MTDDTVSLTSWVNLPGAVRNETPLVWDVTVMAQPDCWAMRWLRSCTQLIRLSGVCLSLKRILKAARASPGITLVVSLPTSIDVKARVEGSKWSLPLSSLCAASWVTSSASTGMGFLAFCG